MAVNDRQGLTIRLDQMHERLDAEESPRLALFAHRGVAKPNRPEAERLLDRTQLKAKARPGLEFSSLSEMEPLRERVELGSL